jgi:translation initiation factor IF-2
MEFVMKEELTKSTKEEKNNTSKATIVLSPIMTVKELAEKLALTVSEVISSLIKNGVTASINDTIDFETAAIIALDLGVKVKANKDKSEENVLDIKKIIANEDKKNLVSRPPIVTIMGHVDHGKTSLLDKIRESNVRGGESGGITQHMGAYQVIKNNNKITFLDTPGHEAFAAMRARGASVTDIVVLVVAADDKVQPQTIESIEYAKAASIPIIVALNKIDSPKADQERIKKELANHDLVPEDWGGKTVVIPVSAKTGQGISDLLEMILLMFEMEDFKANPKVSAVGTVLESHVDKGKGSVATVLIVNGTLKSLDNFVIGEYFGKIRTMENFLGEKINKADPSTPVVLSGFSGLPQAGDTLEVTVDEQEAKERSAEILKRKHVKKIASGTKKQKMQEKKYELKIVLKTDVSGSLEAIEEELEKIEIEDVGVKIIYGGVGDITESDIFQASSTSGEILGFHVHVTPAARKAAKHSKIKITLFEVIYELIQDIRKKMIVLLPPEIKEISIGRLKVLQIFKGGKGEIILGGRVLEGKLEKNNKVKVWRVEKEIGQGVILNIKKIEKDVSEVKKGDECGINLRSEVEIKENDTLEAIKTETSKREGSK